MDLLVNALQEKPDAHFYLVEGFPRNVEQLEDFNKRVSVVHTCTNACMHMHTYTHTHIHTHTHTHTHTHAHIHTSMLFEYLLSILLPLIKENYLRHQCPTKVLLHFLLMFTQARIACW